MAEIKQWKSTAPLCDLGTEIRRDNGKEYSLILALLRNNIDTFAELHKRCKNAPFELLKLRGIGPVLQPLVCKLCQKYSGVPKNFCSNEKALALSDTSLGLQPQVKFKPYIHRIVSPMYDTLDDIQKQCQGNPEKFGIMCKDMNAKGMQKLCSSCEKYLSTCDKCCPYTLERDDAKHNMVPTVYINNVMRGLGISYEEALWVLRYGTSFN